MEDIMYVLEFMPFYSLNRFEQIKEVCWQATADIENMFM